MLRLRRGHENPSPSHDPHDCDEYSSARYFLAVPSCLSHGQMPTNRLYFAMDIPLRLWINIPILKRDSLRNNKYPRTSTTQRPTLTTSHLNTSSNPPLNYPPPPTPPSPQQHRRHPRQNNNLHIPRLITQPPPAPHPHPPPSPGLPKLDDSDNARFKKQILFLYTTRLFPLQVAPNSNLADLFLIHTPRHRRILPPVGRLVDCLASASCAIVIRWWISFAKGDDDGGGVAITGTLVMGRDGWQS